MCMCWNCQCIVIAVKDRKAQGFKEGKNCIQLREIIKHLGRRACFFELVTETSLGFRPVKILGGRLGAAGRASRQRK